MMEYYRGQPVNDFLPADSRLAMATEGCFVGSRVRGYAYSAGRFSFRLRFRDSERE
jgi:hypothetical protein